MSLSVMSLGANTISWSRDMDTMTTIASFALVLGWTLGLNLIWFLVRQFYRSKPPGRQTVVTDLICVCSYFFNLNLSMTSATAIYKLLQSLLKLPAISCSVLSMVMFIWETSLVSMCGIGTCLRLGLGSMPSHISYLHSLIRFSVAHCWTWIHEWSSFRLHALFTLIIILHVMAIWFIDGYLVNSL